MMIPTVYIRIQDSKYFKMKYKEQNEILFGIIRNLQLKDPTKENEEQRR